MPFQRVTALPFLSMLLTRRCVAFASSWKGRKFPNIRLTVYNSKSICSWEMVHYIIVNNFSVCVVFANDAVCLFFFKRKSHFII